MNQCSPTCSRLLELERLEMNLFRGESRDIGSPQVFGGQVLGQALMAAYGTVGGPQRCIRCTPISCAAATSTRRSSTRSTAAATAAVSRSAARRRDPARRSRSSTCRPRSSQAETGLDHQIAMPEVPPPGVAADSESHYRSVAASIACRRARRILDAKAPVRVSLGGAAGSPRRASRRPSSTSGSARVDALAGRRGAASLPAGLRVGFPPAGDGDAAARLCRICSPNLVIASIDHAMWFHRRCASTTGCCTRSTARAPRVRAASRAAAIFATRRPAGRERRAGRADAGDFVRTDDRMFGNRHHCARRRRTRRRHSDFAHQHTRRNAER